MNIEITEELEEFINKKIADGDFSSADDVITKALNDLYADEVIKALDQDDLEKQIEQGLKSGKPSLLQSEEFDLLRKKIRKDLSK